MKFKSLKTRVLVWFAGIIFVILILFSFSFYYFLNKSINLSIETKLYNQAIYIHEKLLPNLSSRMIVKDEKSSSLEILILKNRKIVNKTKKFTLLNYKQYLNQKNNYFILDRGENINAVYVFKFKSPFDGTILIYKKEIDDKVENIIDTMLVLDPLLLFLLLLAAYKLIDKILLPIKNITKIAKEVSITNFSRTIPKPKKEDELKELVDSFNNMVKRLKDGVENMDRFNNDVSHELKTPLTVIKGEIEVALRKPRTPEYYAKSMDTLLYETNQIQKIVEDLLLLTKFSKESIKESFELCNLDTILLENIKKYNDEAKRKNLNLRIKKLEPLSIKANSLLIGTIFSNLIDNAIKYTQEGKNIYISLYENEKIHFVVKDEGIGIPSKKIPKITDRFYRVEESRNKKIKGFGLGLSIVKNSLELHDGALQIDSKEGIGTTVSITI